jgi:uncharacterized protein (DUF1778 family)
MSKTKRKGLGRPTKGSGPAKNQTVLLRVDSDEKKAFGDAADVAGLSVSSWMRERLRRAAVRELEDVARPIAFLTEKAE